MITINKEDYPDVFIDNEELTAADRELFSKHIAPDVNIIEREFFEKMKEKEEGEFAPSADLIMSECDNDDEIYIIRYFFDEYKIGKGKPGNRHPENIYAYNLAEAINADLFSLLGRHVKLIDWLREINFKGINFNGNFILNRS